VADACECGNETSGSRTALFWVSRQPVAVNFLPTFRYNLTVPFSGFKNPKGSLLLQTEFIQGKVWAVKYLSSAVSAPRDGTRGSVRSTRGLGPTMTARGQIIGISIGMLPQTLIISRLDQLSRLGARI
jgi:hypothetical protein